jgi:hypothetical protein
MWPIICAWNTAIDCYSPIGIFARPLEAEWTTGIG